MPLGDSISDGYFIPGGYRIELWYGLKTQGYAVEFVGSASNGPDSLPDRRHEGHSGWRIDQIHEQVAGWLNAAQPNIILLLIGTNDIAQGYKIDTAPDRLDRLIETIFQVTPNVQLFVGSIPPISEPILNQRAIAYNQEVEALVQHRKASGDRIDFVDFYYTLSLDDLPDGVHPNREGFRKIAQAWENAIGNSVIQFIDRETV
jgi:acyl-CoA thioesterase I